MNHLEILRNEHVRLQTKYAELQQRFDILEAGLTLQYVQNGNELTSENNKSFVRRLVDTIIHLYNKNLYRFI